MKTDHLALCLFVPLSGFDLWECLPCHHMWLLSLCSSVLWQTLSHAFKKSKYIMSGSSSHEPGSWNPKVRKHSQEFPGGKCTLASNANKGRETGKVGEKARNTFLWHKLQLRIWVKLYFFCYKGSYFITRRKCGKAHVDWLSKWVNPGKVYSKKRLYPKKEKKFKTGDLT